VDLDLENPAHSDAYYVENDDIQDGQICDDEPKPKPFIAGISEWDEEVWVVYNRWHPLVPRGTVKQPGPPQEYISIQMFNVLKEDKTVSTQIYWTDHDMKLEGPIYKCRGIANDAIPRDGIEKWGPKHVMRLPDLAAVGFTELEDEC
jgi:hypothetical protein